MIKLQNITLAFGERRLIEHASAHFECGKMTALLGRNGTGKSTLLNLMAGLLDPNAGTIAVEGVDVAQRGTALYTALMIVPEEFSLPQLTLDRFVKVTAPFSTGTAPLRYLGAFLSVFTLSAIAITGRNINRSNKSFFIIVVMCLGVFCKLVLFQMQTYKKYLRYRLLFILF